MSIIIFCPFSSNKMDSYCDLLLSYSVIRYCYDGHVLIGSLDFFCEDPVFFFPWPIFFLLVIYFTNIFSWFVACPFTILMVNVDELRLLVLMKFNLSLCIVHRAFESYLRKPNLIPAYKDSLLYCLLRVLWFYPVHLSL